VFTLGVCAALALAASVADGLILVIYDPRYQAASWMLSVLLGGAVFAVLSNLNEALLLSAGRPFYASVANMMRLATLAILLPTGHRLAGFPGAVVAVAVTELLQYGYIAVGLHRVRMSFWRQDALWLCRKNGNGFHGENTKNYQKLLTTTANNAIIHAS
jgi:O-antigen/teichoic acid export membrane protein